MDSEQSSKKAEKDERLNEEHASGQQEGEEAVTLKQASEEAKSCCDFLERQRVPQRSMVRCAVNCLSTGLDVLDG